MDGIEQRRQAAGMQRIELVLHVFHAAGETLQDTRLVVELDQKRLVFGVEGFQ